jgi:hypothetical protein
MLALLLAAALLGACATTESRRLHYSLTAEPVRPFPTRLLLLPIDIKAHELTAGGLTEEVPAWSAQAHDNLLRALAQFAAADGRFEFTPLAELPGERGAAVREHVALYNAVAGAAYTLPQGGGEAWRHKRERFDYGIGPGLAFLREHADAQAALLVVGEDYISSSGRKAAAVAAALVGVGIPMGFSYLTAGIVDLESGDLLWFDLSASYAARDLRRYEDVSALLAQVFASLPGTPPATGKDGLR